jgi:hypothetical protein
VQIELDQARALKGEHVDLFHLVRMSNTLTRLLWSLGISRRKRKDLGAPDLGKYLAKEGAK